MTQPINHFLLVFDHSAGRLLDTISFGEDSDAALAAYAEYEAEYWRQRHIEIVLVGSDSLDTVKLTHANYFDGFVATSKYLTGIG